MPVYKDSTRDRYVFEFDARIEGQRVRTTKLLPKSFSRAQAQTYDRKKSAELSTQVRGGERAAHTIQQAVKLYVEKRCAKLKSGDNTEDELRRVASAYDGKRLEQLPEACRAITEKGEAEGWSPATIRNRIRYLTAACRYAWKYHGLGEHDPAERVVVPEVNNERHVYATRAQVLQMARAIKSDPTHEGLWRECRAIHMVLFYSGMRVSEALRAELRGNAFYLGTTKNGKPRLVPVHPRLRNFLWVYDGRAMPAKITVQKHIRLAREACGLTDVHVHDLRHSAASEMINAGVDLYTVGAVLGHRDSRSTQRYAHLATDTLAVAVAKIGRKAA